MVKQSLLKLANTPAFTAVLNTLECLDRSSDHLVRILTYHRVDELNAQPHLSRSILSATPDMFAGQMRFIAENYTPIQVHILLDYLTGKSSLPEKAVLVTFDDAYRDFKENAWPILQSYDIPVVLFVPTAYPDNPDRMLWWDKLYAAIQYTQQGVIASEVGLLPLTTNVERKRAFKLLRNQIKSLPNAEAMKLVDDCCEQLRVEFNNDNGIMNWATLKQLAAEGVTLAPHTRHHPMLNRISVEEAEQEAIGSLHDLQQQIGEVLPIFAYPSGGANEAVANRLQNAGFKLAFTTERGFNDMSSANPLLLNRNNVGLSTSVNIMHAQMINSIARMTRVLV